MDHAVRVQILEGVDNLLGVALDLEFMESLAALQKFVHALILAELKQDIHIFTILEKLKELSHIGMLDRPVNFDFTHQLLFCPTSLQRRLLDNFGGTNCLCLHRNELVAFCEATFTQELSFHVLPIGHLAILLLYALLNDLMLSSWITCVAPARRMKGGLTAAVRAALNQSRSLCTCCSVSSSSSSRRLWLKAIGTI